MLYTNLLLLLLLSLLTNQIRHITKQCLCTLLNYSGELNLPGSASLEAGYSNNSTATAVTSPHDRTATILSSSSSSNLASGSSGGTCTFSDNNTNDNDSLDNTSKVAITRYIFFPFSIYIYC